MGGGEQQTESTQISQWRTYSYAGVGSIKFYKFQTFF